MKKKKFNPMTLLIIVIAVVCGMILGKTLADSMFKTDMSKGQMILRYVLLIVLIVVSVYIQIILHELGHMLCGLKTGYKFVSFRIGSFMLLKTNGETKFKRMSLAGTGGQCLMSPPDYNDGNYPYKLYMLGGVLMNVVTAIISTILALVIKAWFFHALFLCLAITGFVLAISNGLPVDTGAIVSDGYNVKELGRNKDARRALWQQLAINDLQMQGVRLKDMPDEYFAIDANADMKNVLISTIDVFCENRFMDAQNFDAAEKEILYLLADCCNVLGVYKTMLKLDRTYIDLLKLGEYADISELNKGENKKVMEQMKNFPSVLRTQYAAALIKENDAAKQEKLLAQFAKIKDTYPSPADIASESELMELCTHREDVVFPLQNSNLTR